MTRLEIEMLGPFVVRRDGTPISLGSHRTEALFSYLVMTGRPQSRDHLVDLLWEDHRSGTAPGNLRVLLTNLRKSVGDFVTISRTSAGFLAPPDATWDLDVHVLEQRSENALGRPPEQATVADRRDLADALRSCGGDFLERLDLTRGTRFDDWARGQRDRLGRRRRAVLAHLAAAELAAGKVPDALRHAQELVSLEVLSEPAHQLVIRALVQAGDMDGAAQQFETLERTMRAELGTTPGPATRALFLGLPEGRGVKAAVLPSPRSADRVKRPWTAFAGRTREERLILRAAAHARHGSGGMVIVKGAPGSGKSVLVRGVVKTLLEQGPEWVAVGGASTALLPGADGDLAVDVVAMQLAGETGGSWLDGPMPLVVADRIREHTRERRFVTEAWDVRREAAVVGRLRALAGAHPVVLVLENLQWASPATIGLLLELASDVRRRQLLVVGTLRPWHRPGQAADLADHLLPRLRRTAAASIVDLDLDARARSSFVRDVVGVEQHQLPDDLLVELERLAGGHPAMVVELLRDLVRRGGIQRGPGGLRLNGLPEWRVPAPIGVLVDEWVSGLPDDARALLSAAATLDVVEVERLAALTGRAPAGVHRVLARELSERFGLMSPVGSGRYRFRHPIVRDHLRSRFTVPAPRPGRSPTAAGSPSPEDPTAARRV